MSLRYLAYQGPCNCPAAVAGWQDAVPKKDELRLLGLRSNGWTACQYTYPGGKLIIHTQSGTLIHDTAASMKLESCLACGLVLILWMLPQKALIQNLFCSTRVHAFDKWQVYPGRFWVSNDSICSKFEFDPGIQVTSQSLAWHALTGPDPMPNLNRHSVDVRFKAFTEERAAHRASSDSVLYSHTPRMLMANAM